MTAPSRRGLVLVLVVVGLAAWSGIESLWQWSMVPEPPVSVTISVLWSFALPLPILFVRRWPTAAALGVAALIVSRAAAGYRGPGSVAQSLILLVVLFLAEAAARSRPGWPIRGTGVAAAFLGAVAAMDLYDIGDYKHPPNYPHVLMLLAGGVGAGVALRDRREEATRLEAELRATDVGGAERARSLIAAERSRIAGEIDRAVGLLLDRVRPLAERAARTTAPDRLVRDMATVQESARSAMTEMRRALGLLRAPVGEADERADVAAATAATRRTRALQAVGWTAPILLLATVGLIEQSELPPRPTPVPGMQHTITPAPLLGPASPWITVILGVLPLLARARVPLVASVSVSALLIGRFLIHDLSELTYTQWYIAAAAAFLGAAHARSVVRGALAGILAVAASLTCMALEQIPYEAFAYSFAALLPAASAVGGLLVRDRVATAARARRAREEVARRHEELARERVAAERLRAARELHDVVGHAVTVVGLQAAVAKEYAAVDIDRARLAAGTVAEVTAEAERDLARLTSYLEPNGSQPPPRSLTELVDRVRAAGLPVELDEQVSVSELPLALGQVVFRLVQEALTNVSRHAGKAPTAVTVSQTGECVVVEVVNALQGGGRPSHGGGGGVIGMRERAELYGGTLEAGPDGDGRWRVCAELPLDVSAGAGSVARLGALEETPDR